MFLFYLIGKVHCETMNNSFLERDTYVLCFQSDSHSFLLASKSLKRSDWHQPVRAEINNWRASQRLMDDAFIRFCYCVQREHWRQFSCHLSITNGSRSETSESKQLTRDTPAKLEVVGLLRGNAEAYLWNEMFCQLHNLISNWKNKSFYGITESLEGFDWKGP